MVIQRNEPTIYSPNYLNLAGFIPRTKVLGPGNRTALWLQGCPFHCKGCIAPDWIPQIQANLVSVDQMIGSILEIQDIQGLTISGGEPMLQAESLAAVISGVRRSRQVDVICFTGFQYEMLLQKPPNPGVINFLAEIDLLIDGPYIAELNQGVGFRGSSNQKFIYLTDKLKEVDFENVPRKIEIQISDDNIFIAGIPDPNFLEKFDAIIENLPKTILENRDERA